MDFAHEMADPGTGDLPPALHLFRYSFVDDMLQKSRKVTPKRLTRAIHSRHTVCKVWDQGAGTIWHRFCCYLTLSNETQAENPRCGSNAIIIGRNTSYIG